MLPYGRVKGRGTIFLGEGNVKFEFAHVGINAQTPGEGVRMKDFFTNVMGYHDYREIPAGYFTVDNKMELLKKSMQKR